MTKKKKTTSAPPVKQEEPAKSEEAELVKPEPAEPKPQPPISIDPALVKQAEQFGIPVQQLIDWAASVEQRLSEANENFQVIQESFTQLQPLVDLSKQVQQAQNQPQPTAGSPPQAPPMQGNMLGSIMQVLPYFLGGGGGGNEQLQKMAMDALSNQIKMSSAITNAVVAKITGKATSEVAEAVTGA